MEKLLAILSQHKLYLGGSPAGLRADLSGADLTGADLPDTCGLSSPL